MNLVLALVLTAGCDPGQAVGPETAGHCCWSGQVWSKMQNRCVGMPACPGGMSPQGDTCVIACPAGQAASADTAGRCCWANQVWSSIRNVCVGVPVCPPGLTVAGESCVALQQQGPPAYTAPPPAYTAPPPAYAAPPPAYTAPPPTYAAPPANDAPRAPMTITPAASPQRAALETQLVDLRKQHASIGFGGDVLAICVGIPAMIIGGVVFGLARKGEDLFWGGFLFVDGVILTLVGTIGIPVKAGKKGRLTRQINETEGQLRALDQRVTLFPPALEKPLGLAFAISSPVIRF